MISIRYICFAVYYIFINSAIVRLNELTLESMGALFISTVIFFYIIKLITNETKTNNKTESKTQVFISILYGILSLSIKYIYDIFINIDSISTVLPFIKDNYVPEALFISGGLLFLNQLMIIIYPYL
jgi:hypothetical protein